jgi:glycosyltransferase involved in cell wall biosynthesis
MNRAERALGYRSDSLVYEVYRIGARDQFTYVLERFYRVPVVGRLVPYGAFLWAGFRYDIFSFFFDGGLLGPTPWWRTELALLKLAGKKIVVNPYGGDARLPSRVRERGGWHDFVDVPSGTEDRNEEDVTEHLEVFGRYADAVLGCADLYEDLPRVDGMFHYPFDTAAWTPIAAPDDDVITVVHAPNHRHYKGTRYLERAIERLRSQGVQVELVLVESLRNDEARRIYERADVIADQFLNGAYAMFAMEGMALGKPVICYLSDRFRPAHPEWDECPIVSATPDTLEDELRRLATDRELRVRLGDAGPPYVERYHSLAVVGVELDAVYRSVW